MSHCPCCSGKEFSDCCEPFLLGLRQPPTAEALMRSRYTAYARANLDYLFESSGAAVRKEFDHDSTRKWAESAEWHGLEILRTEAGGEQDQRGVIEFLARYTIGERTCNHREIADFVRVHGQWKFEDGRVLGPDPVRREAPKVGRNDACPCGSGKKYKKCCASMVAAPEATASEATA